MSVPLRSFSVSVLYEEYMKSEYWKVLPYIVPTLTSLLYVKLIVS
jgi:hypothetical protein